jgi:TrpR-related protein YerC/YecD
MQATENMLWKTSPARQLAKALIGIDDIATMQMFLRDVMTEKEIIEVSARLEAARLLQAGATYADIIEKTNLSSRTIARINNWMKNGKGGYTAALKSLDSHHRSPVRAE